MKKLLLALLLVANTTIYAQVTITMEQEAGVYKVPCIVNGAKMKFIFDTGAATVCLSESMAEYLLDNDYISKEDFIGTGSSTVADGRTVSHLKIILRDIEIAGLHLKDVEASVVEGQRAPLLLGQTAIQKLGKVSIDGNMLIIENGTDGCKINNLYIHDVTFSELKELAFKSDSYNGDWYPFVLAECLRYGECTSSDIQSAIYWYRVAAERGNLDAISILGDCYYFGNGVGKNYSTAVYWYEQAAANNHARSLYSLGWCYGHGQGINENIDKGFDYTVKATKSKIGFYSTDANKDASEELKNYFNRYYAMVQNGNMNACFYVGYCYANGYGINVDKQQALHYYTKGAELGSYACMNNLAVLYEQGEGGIKKDMITALYWYKKAAKEDVVAQRNLGKKYYYGNESLKPDYIESLFWFQQAAKQGDIESQVWIADYYRLGIGVQKNYTIALEKYFEVIRTLEDKYNIWREQDDIVLMYNRAAYRVGLIYSKGGDGVDKDINKTIEYWDTKCYHYGYAYYELYKIFQEGKEVPKDIKRAQNNLSANWTIAKWKSTEGLNALAYEFAKGTNGWAVQWDNAYKVIDEAIELDPYEPNYYDTKGELYSMQGKYKEAKEMWLKVKAIEPSFYSKYSSTLNKYIIQHSK